MWTLDNRLVQLALRHAPATVRQLFYQAVVLGWLAKTEGEYKTISERLVILREAGQVSWEAIADRTRWQRKPPTWPDLASAVASVKHYYRREVWRHLPDRVFVALEKEALSGIVNEVTSRYDVPLLVLRGFSSATFVHDLADQVLGYKQYGLRSHVLVLTDLDPSGKVSAASLRDRLARYCGITDSRRAPAVLPSWLTFTRLGVTRSQVEEYELPSRPTKTDGNPHARSAMWDGGDSVELDAFSPDDLRRLVTRAIEEFLPAGHMEGIRVAEESEREIAAEWEAAIRRGARPPSSDDDES